MGEWKRGWGDRGTRGLGDAEGRRAQDQDKYQPHNPRINDENYSQWSLEIQQYRLDLRTLMGKEQFGDRSSVHLSSGGWPVLGLVFHDLYVTLRDRLNSDEKASILGRLAGIDWTRYNPKWIDLFGDPEVDDQGRPRLGKSTRWGSKVKSELLAYVRDQAGITQHLPMGGDAGEETAEDLDLDDAPALAGTA